MLYWILLYSCSLLIATFHLASSRDSARPLIIALPIRVQANQEMPIPMASEDIEQEESEEEMQGEQRLVPRAYNPNTGRQYSQRYDEDANSRNPQSNFLSWNPGNKFMVLQINDVIGARQEEASESDETDRPDERQAEEPTEPAFPVSARQNWANFQGSYDFEEARRMAILKHLQEQQKMLMPETVAKKRKKKSRTPQNSSSEDAEQGDVYGTDPVVHYLRSKSNTSGEQYNFGEMPEDTDEGFNLKDWFKY